MEPILRPPQTFRIYLFQIENDIYEDTSPTVNFVNLRNLISPLSSCSEQYQFPPQICNRCISYFISGILMFTGILGACFINFYGIICEIGIIRNVAARWIKRTFPLKIVSWVYLVSFLLWFFVSETFFFDDSIGPSYVVSLIVIFMSFLLRLHFKWYKS